MALALVNNGESGLSARTKINANIAGYNNLVLSVKDFGAVGNGSTDDTAAIQACFDAAFGTWASPHGASGVAQNIPVYFPPGLYIVNSAFAARSITGTTNNSGAAQLTVSTAGLSTGDMVYVRGVGGTTSANGSWSITVNDSSHLTLNSSQFNSAWTSGGTICPSALRIRSLQGGRLFGAGRFASVIQNNTANAAVLSTNGFGYNAVENLNFAASNGGIGFDLNWDNTGSVALQENTLVSLFTGGTGSSTPDYGCTVGMNGFMGSENTWLNCYFAATTGLYIGNFNALDNEMFGGQCQGCTTGILVGAGSVPTIHGVCFENVGGGQIADISIVNGASDSYSIAGCRSESANFLSIGAGQPFHISGCRHTGTGLFFSGAGYVTISNCSSAGTLNASGYMTIVNCLFSNVNYLTANGHNYNYLQVIPPLVTQQTGSTYTINSVDCSSKVQFNSSSSQTVSVIGDGSVRLGLGSKIEVQQIGTGQTTFQGTSGATINSANGLKLRAQYSVATLTCDATNVWTLAGDTAV